MTPIDRRKKQYQLEALRARKAKADGLGAEVIARTRTTYDGICAEINLLERELAEDDAAPVKQLTALIMEMIRLPWPQGTDYFAKCELDRPQLLRTMERFEIALTAAAALNKLAEFKVLLPKYREAYLAFNQYVNAPPAQKTIWDEIPGEVVPRSELPWKD